jgi:hypothetical protein
MDLCRTVDFRRAKDSITQWISSPSGFLLRSGFHRAENVAAQNMLSRRGHCRAKKVVAHRMLSLSGFRCVVRCRAMDFPTHRMQVTLHKLPV